MSQPAAVASWQRNGAAVNGSNYVIKSTVSAGLFTSRVSSNLTILAAEKSDFGRYECTGENTIGRSNSSADIIILCKYNSAEYLLSTYLSAYSPVSWSLTEPLLGQKLYWDSFDQFSICCFFLWSETRRKTLPGIVLSIDN